ncbi:hypothetical protein K523DRAFT_357597 [Schizophyllum commune Tattone D]|nr:hypothetical protein K523DRAFT_357597 [Schizophyllum commune Tattone D]
MAEEETHSMDLNSQHIADVRLDTEGVRRARQAVRRLEQTLARELGVSVTILIESLGSSASDDDDDDTAAPAAPSPDANAANNAADNAANNAADEPNSTLNETRRWPLHSSSPTAIGSGSDEDMESDTETASSDGSGEGGSEEEGDDEDGEEDSEEENEDDGESEGEVANDDASVSSTEEILVQLASGAPLETYITAYRGPRHPGPTHRAELHPLRGTESATPSLGNRGRTSSSARNAGLRAPATRGTSIRGLPRRGGYARGGMSTRPVYGNGLGFPSSSSTSLGTPPPSPTSDWAGSLGWPVDEPFPADAWEIGKPLQRPDGTWTPPLQFHPPARGDGSVRRFLRFPPTPALPHPLRSEPSAAATRPRARPPPIVTPPTTSNASDTRPLPIEISSDEDKPATTIKVGSQDDIPVANISRRVIDLTAGDSDDDANSQDAGAVRPQTQLSDARPIEIISDSDESVRARRMSTIDLSDGEEDEVRAALQPPTGDEAGHVEGSDAEMSYASEGEKSADM